MKMFYKEGWCINRLEYIIESVDSRIAATCVRIEITCRVEQRLFRIFAAKLAENIQKNLSSAVVLFRPLDMDRMDYLQCLK